MREPDRLARRLGLADAVFVGPGSMIGAGAFVAISPAAEAAGTGLLIGLLAAGAVALLNAMSSAQLARLYPVSGGTYAYAGRRLGDIWGWMAGWGFVAGKLASCAAAALTFGHYALPGQAPWLAALAVAALTALNYLGVERTAAAVKVIVLVTLSSLVAVFVMAMSGASGPLGSLPLPGPDGLYGVLQSAGIWFFAFAGYARIATLGEEVRDPERTIPRAMVLSLGIVLLVYAAVSMAALLAIGPEALARSDDPLAMTVSAMGFGQWRWVVVLGASMATLGVMLSLMAGIDRTLFAMAADHRMPSYMAKVHPVHKVPHLAGVTVGVILIIIVLTVDVRSAIGFSAFTVLLYYAITNLSAITLSRSERMLGRWSAFAGLLGRLVLSFTLPPGAVIAGGLVMLVGLALYLAQWRRARSA